MTSLRTGVVMLGALLAACILVPPLLDLEPNRQNLSASLAPPSADYLLGADEFGRSILARLLEGGRLSLTLAFVTVSLCLVTGVGLAAGAALAGRAVEGAITALADAVYAAPGLLFVMLVAGLFGGSAVALVIALWAASWPEYYRLSRLVLQRTFASEHVATSRILGVNPVAILGWQVVPDVAPHVTAVAALSFGRVVLALASLGFLGFGVAPPQAEWGAMITSLRPFAHAAPAQILAPVVAIVWTVVAVSLIGSAVARADIRTRGRG